MVPDGSGRDDVSYKPPKDVRHTMPAPKTSDKDKEKKDDKVQPQNRKVMVTMMDGGLPVVAVSKRDKTSNSVKKEKAKVI